MRALISYQQAKFKRVKKIKSKKYVFDFCREK